MLNKFSFLVPTYNNGKYLKYCLDSIIDFAYEIKIVEGCWDVTKPNRSTDNTMDVIDNFLVVHNKVHLIQYKSVEGEDDRTDTYRPNILFNQIRAKQQAVRTMTGDWMFMVDSDEIYKPEDLVKLDKWLYNYKITDEFFTFKMPAFVFYFNHYFGTKEYFTRLSRIWESPVRLDWEDQILGPDGGRPSSIEVPEDVCYMYHYGYPSVERAVQKMDMWREDCTTEWIGDFIKRSENGDIIEGENYHLFSQKLGYGYNQKFEKFVGEHPDLVLKALKNKEI